MSSFMTIPDHVLRSWLKHPRGVTLRVAHTSRKSEHTFEEFSLCSNFEAFLRGNTLLSSDPGTEGGPLGNPHAHDVEWEC